MAAFQRSLLYLSIFNFLSVVFVHSLIGDGELFGRTRMDLQAYYSYTSNNAGSSLSCALECVREGTCSGFQFTDSSHECKKFDDQVKGTVTSNLLSANDANSVDTFIKVKQANRTCDPKLCSNNGQCRLNDDLIYECSCNYCYDNDDCSGRGYTETKDKKLTFHYHQAALDLQACKKWCIDLAENCKRVSYHGGEKFTCHASKSATGDVFDQSDSLLFTKC